MKRRALMSEAHLQSQVCQWLKIQYPSIIFTSEASGQRLTIGQAKKAKTLRSGNGLPDLIILEPRGNFYGLCMELKAKSPFKKDGKTLRTDPHLQEQDATLTRLSQKGYYAEFATGFDQAVEIISNYMDQMIEI